jgi:hypothetical protein
VEAPNYRTLATSEPIVVPAVEAWRREAARRERWIAIRFAARGGYALVMVAFLLFIRGVRDPMPVAVATAVIVPVLVVVMIVQFRRNLQAEGARIVVRFDRPWAVPNRSHWHGRALAQNWNALVTEAQARNIPNPEAFLAVASDTTAWFPVREGLDVFQALAESPSGAPARADLTLLVDALSTAPPPSPSMSEDAPSPASRTDASAEPIRFRLEYVDARDRRSANELLASGYCVGQTRDLRA